jgi:hypothetical protein
MTRSARWLLVGFGLLWSVPVAANPRQLAFSYPATTLPESGIEVEQFVDLVPVRVLSEQTAGSRAVTSLRFDLQTEIEYGITDRLEFGWYFMAGQGAGDGQQALRFEGIKQRLRYRFGFPGQYPVDAGVYLEIAEKHDEFEIEEKVILTRRLGALTLFANLWVEQEWLFQADDWKFFYNPTFGAAYSASPALSLGLEYWTRGEFANGLEGSHHYLGPNVMVQGGELWLTTGVYARMDALTKSTQLDDPWGKVWIRTIVGIGL